MERYEIVKDIGSGNFAVAKLVRDKWTKEYFAVKFIERGQKVCFIFFTLSISFSMILNFHPVCYFLFLSDLDFRLTVEMCNCW